MSANKVKILESFSAEDLEYLEFLPEELESIESELYPDFESISFEDVAKEMEAYLEGKDKDKGKKVIGSKQGEHVFNALDALALEIARTLENKLKDQNKNNSSNAVNAINALKDSAQRLKQERNHEFFGTAEPGKGDTENSKIYSDFVGNTRSAVDTFSIANLQNLKNILEGSTIDQKAKQSKINFYKGNNKNTKSFIDWFNETKKLMYSTYEALIKATQEVEAMRRSPSRSSSRSSGTTNRNTKSSKKGKSI